MSGEYLAWRTTDMARPTVRIDGMGNRAAYRRSVCERCGEPVWVNRPHAKGRLVVCWPCVRREGQ